MHFRVMYQRKGQAVQQQNIVADNLKVLMQDLRKEGVEHATVTMLYVHLNLPGGGVQEMVAYDEKEHKRKLAEAASANQSGDDGKVIVLSNYSRKPKVEEAKTSSKPHIKLKAADLADRSDDTPLVWHHQGLYSAVQV